MKKFLLFLLATFMWSNVINAQTAGGVSQVEYDALVDLYDATNGPNWTTKTNWTTGNVANWFGVTVEDGHVTELKLPENNLVGSIPISFGDLHHLNEINFNENKLSGSIPAEFGGLINLKVLRLYENKLSGPIPPEFGSLISLSLCDLGRNNLSGAIPPEIGQLINLTSLTLSVNNLSGALPTEISALTKLWYLNLGYNQLSGSIPSSLGEITTLQDVYLNKNKLTGEIPPELGYLTNLRNLELGNNQLSGTIPISLGYLVNLRRLDLGVNQLSGPIPAEFGNLTDLYALYLDNNQLSGSIPAEFRFLDKLTSLYLYENQLSGVEGSLVQLTQLGSFLLFRNQFTFADLALINIPIGSYSPQAFVNISQTEDAETITLSAPSLASVGGEEYQWYMNKEKLNFETNRELIVYKEEQGTFYCGITNSNFPELTLWTKDVVIDTYTLTYTAGANGSISGDGNQKVSHGANGSEVEAIPATNYYFVKWSDGVSTAIRSERNVTMDVAVQAEFALKTYLVTFLLKGSDNLPLTNATIKIDNKEVVTDAQGKAEFLLPNGISSYIILFDGQVVKTDHLTVAGEDTTVQLSLPYTGIETEMLLKVKISPNPFADQLTITDALEIVRVEISNLMGETLFNQTYTGQNEIVVNSSAFDAGVYLVSVHTADSNKLMKKMVKRK
ncbi:MAG TPA: T9SS type A sorting domain-containing protein [Marinilabiliaceae bacterium]|nr:T9SS type A sorting domain-containing protein [Marinilabiliaceae bacterium]